MKSNPEETPVTDEQMLFPRSRLFLTLDSQETVSGALQRRPGSPGGPAAANSGLSRPGPFVGPFRSLVLAFTQKLGLLLSARRTGTRRQTEAGAAVRDPPKPIELRRGQSCLEAELPGVSSQALRPGPSRGR